MKNKIILWLFLCIHIAFGCNKNMPISEAERNGNLLKEAISANGINRVLTVISGDFEPSIMDAENGLKYSFNDGFLKIDDYTNKVDYDLNNLASYRVSFKTIKNYSFNTSKNEKVLVVTFKNR